MTTAISFEQVTQRFGGVLALNGVTLRVQAGATIALVGDNGAGKTTAFGLMAGWLKPSAGRLEVLGGNPRALAVRQQMAVLPQDAALPSEATARDWLRHLGRLEGLSDPVQSADQALERVGLQSVADRAMGQFSHGMAKRIGLAQCVLSPKALYLFDEPTAGLDIASQAAVHALIRELKGRATVVVSSHQASELEQLCDELWLLKKGQVARAESMAKVLKRGQVFQVRVIRGEVNVEALRVLPGIQSVQHDAPMLVFHVDEGVPTEDVTANVLSVLLAAGVRFDQVSAGQSLGDALK